MGVCRLLSSTLGERVSIAQSTLNFLCWHVVGVGWGVQPQGPASPVGSAYWQQWRGGISWQIFHLKNFINF